MFNKKKYTKYTLYKIYKFISKFLFPHTQSEIESKFKLKNYFIYLDYVRGRSLNASTNKVNPPFNNIEYEALLEIIFNLSPAAQKIILTNTID